MSGRKAGSYAWMRDLLVRVEAHYAPGRGRDMILRRLPLRPSTLWLPTQHVAVHGLLTCVQLIPNAFISTGPRVFAKVDVMWYWS